MEVKTVGTSGQISLGKQYAGRTVIVDEVEAGVWMIKTAVVIPDNERWLHTPEAKASLDRALAWAAANPAAESDLDALEAKLKRRHRSLNKVPPMKLPVHKVPLPEVRGYLQPSNPNRAPLLSLPHRQTGAPNFISQAALLEPVPKMLSPVPKRGKTHF